ncbi:discoidin domain-containing protein [Streptomyces gramineus]|uniref:discoidin domain-containing protein n=1 Tax=Streptomyces gramineus TaxID=910542 RepID=UPI00398BBBB4
MARGGVPAAEPGPGDTLDLPFTARTGGGVHGGGRTPGAPGRLPDDQGPGQRGLRFEPVRAPDDTLELTLRPVAGDHAAGAPGATGRYSPTADTVPLMDVDSEAERLTPFLVAPVPPRTLVDGRTDLDDPIPAVPPQPGQARPIRSDWHTRRQNALRPGDLICGDCGQGNAPRRRFCARCGNGLEEAEVVRRRWWHRLRPRRGPRQIALTADAPGQRSSSEQEIDQPGERRRRWLLRTQIAGSGVIALSTLGYATYPPLQNYVNHEVRAVRQQAEGVLESHYDLVRPATVTASSSLDRHGPEQAADQFDNTYWAAEFADKGDAPPKPRSLTFHFDRLVTLNQVVITAGAVKGFTAHGRPSVITLSFSNGASKSLTLKDSGSPQKFELDRAVGFKSVKMTVEEEFAGTEHADVAVTEVKFLSLVS